MKTLMKDYYVLFQKKEFAMNIYREIENAEDYAIDYMIERQGTPLFIFGVPGKDKARLTTIVIERLLRAKVDFDSLLIFSDMGNIPKQDIARLTNVGGK